MPTDVVAIVKTFSYSFYEATMAIKKCADTCDQKWACRSKILCGNRRRLRQSKETVNIGRQ